MTYPLIPRFARRSAKPKLDDPVTRLKLGGGYQPPAAPVRPSQAVGEMLQAAEGFDPPYGGDSAGEMLPNPGPPVVTELQPTELPAPEWAGQVASPSLAREVPTRTEPPSALSVMKHAAGDVEEPGQFAPPVVTKPLERPVPPRPDWSAEQRAREPSEGEPAFIEPADWSKSSP